MKKKNMLPQVFDVVTVGERGQIVIPAKARKEFSIKAGDKLVAISGGGHPALVLMKTDEMSAMIDDTLKKFGEVKSILGRGK